MPAGPPLSDAGAVVMAFVVMAVGLGVSAYIAWLIWLGLMTVLGF